MIEGDIGRVLSRYGAELLVDTINGLMRCTTRRKLDYVTCGDYVRWQQLSHSGNATATEVLTRKNELSRIDFRGRLRAIAANVDVMMVVNSWLPSPAWDMLDRYLITAHQLSMQATIIINKQDLESDFASSEDYACLAEYEALGYPILHTRTLSAPPKGIAELQEYLHNKTAILTGLSGVGKSSLANCLLPDEDIRVDNITATGEGRHTTTVARLYPLPYNGALIDSPGVRDFALPDLNAQQVRAGYPEFRELAEQCRFNNCSHHHEPGCAVKTAYQNKQIPQRRYERYLTLLHNIKHN